MKKLPIIGIGLVLLMKYAKSVTKEAKEETLLMFIADEFGYKLDDFTEGALYGLNAHIMGKATIATTPKEENVLEIAKGSIIAIAKSWVDYEYKGFIHPTTPTYLLRINGIERSTRFIEEGKIKELSENIACLFDEAVSAKVAAFKKVQALYDIFESPRMHSYIKGYSLLMQTVTEISEGQELGGLDMVEDKQTKASQIIDRYLAYLWEKHSDNTEIRYILCFESYLVKHKDQWRKKGVVPQTEVLNLELEEHEQVVSIFDKFKEPKVLYRTWKKTNQKQKLGDLQSAKLAYKSGHTMTMPLGLSSIIGQRFKK